MDSGGRVVPIGVCKYKRFQAELVIPTSFARHQLSKHLSSLVMTWGETVALDEKMRKWRGESPHYLSIPGKTEPRGHWTTELVVLLNGVDLPFCVGLFPFESCSNIDESHDKSVIWAWVNGLLPPTGRPCVVADSYYLTRPMVATLVDSNIRFCCSLKPANFKEYVAMLGKGVDAIGMTSVLHHEKSNLIAVHHWDTDSNIGKKYVLSNSFKVF